MSIMYLKNYMSCQINQKIDNQTILVYMYLNKAQYQRNILHRKIGTENTI